MPFNASYLVDEKAFTFVATLECFKVGGEIAWPFLVDVGFPVLFTKDHHVASSAVSVFSAAVSVSSVATLLVLGVLPATFVIFVTETLFSARLELLETVSFGNVSHLEDKSFTAMLSV